MHDLMRVPWPCCKAPDPPHVEESAWGDFFRATMEAPSAYELTRAENIRRNQERLAELGLGDGGIIPPRLPSNKMRPRTKATAMPVEPERRSVRNQGAKAPGFYVEQELARSGKIVVGGDTRAFYDQKENEEKREVKREDPLERFGYNVFPEGEEHLLEGEQHAFRALRDARRAAAKELQLEGYKIAHNRSLCEMVRRLPSNDEELSACWGFGGSGKRVRDHGELFLDVLRPRVDKLRAVHETARVAWEERKHAEAAVQVLAAEEVASASGVWLDQMPQAPDQLIEAEAAAYAALIEATHVRAEEIGEQYVWNIAPSRSLCEMTRRCPIDMEGLRECWGFGGAGKKAAKHGAFLLAALQPLIPSIHQAHMALQASEVGRKDEEEVTLSAATDDSLARREDAPNQNLVEADAVEEGASPPPPLPPASTRSTSMRAKRTTSSKRPAVGTDAEAAPRRRTRLSAASALSCATSM